MVSKITGVFSKLTDGKRVKVFILDDSVVTRNRSKSVELMACVYDHVTQKYQKGFTMLSSPNESNRLVDTSATIDKRTNGHKGHL